MIVVFYEGRGFIAGPAGETHCVFFVDNVLVAEGHE